MKINLTREFIHRLPKTDLHFHSCGNVRKAMKLIRSVEEIGRYKNLEVVS